MSFCVSRVNHWVNLVPPRSNRGRGRLALCQLSYILDIVRNGGTRTHDLSISIRSIPLLRFGGEIYMVSTILMSKSLARSGDLKCYRL
jgi:hypothetical protein